jgi:hypothetical protein
MLQSSGLNSAHLSASISDPHAGFTSTLLPELSNAVRFQTQTAMTLKKACFFSTSQGSGGSAELALDCWLVVVVSHAFEDPISRRVFGVRAVFHMGDWVCVSSPRAVARATASARVCIASLW